ncbi:MAG TPA: Calx-beta domain-containing protein, partial [Acidimicrobiales bacterium]
MATLGVTGALTPGVAGANSPGQTPPTITLTTPADNAIYRVGQVVHADYTCSAATSISSCVGDVANGAAVNTSVSGPHLFKVTATDTSGNVSTVAHAYRVLPGTATIIGPTNAGALAGGPASLSGATATVKISAPAANGSEIGVGDTIHIDWALYQASIGALGTGHNGPNPMVWTLPAPTNAVIDGPVTTDQVGLHAGETAASAHTGAGTTGVLSVTPAVPANASQVVVSFDDDSAPDLLSLGDGVLVHIGFTAKVITPGLVTIPGFPALTGTDCLLQDLFCTPFTTTTGIGGPGVSFQAVDTVAPAIAITSPANGAVLAPGAPLTAAFTCTDNAVPAALCQGDVASGSLIDTSVAGPHQFHVSSSDSAGNLAQSWTTYFVSDPTLSVASCQTAPGFNCSFPVTLSNPSGKAVTVHYATADGSATAGSGAYTPTSGTLTFPSGTTTKPVDVVVPANAGAGTFSLTLTAPTNATLGTATATGTIGAPAPTMAIADASVVRPASGTTGLDFPITLSAASPTDVTVHYATTNGTAAALVDYQATTGTLTIPAGQTSGLVTVPIIGNQNDQPDRQFTVTLSSSNQATLTRSVATGTV